MNRHQELFRTQMRWTAQGCNLPLCCFSGREFNPEMKLSPELVAQLPEQTPMEKSPWPQAGTALQKQHRMWARHPPTAKYTNWCLLQGRGAPSVGWWPAHTMSFSSKLWAELLRFERTCSTSLTGAAVLLMTKNELIYKYCTPLTVFSQEEKTLIMRLCCQINANSHLSYSGLKAQTQV